MDIEDLLIPAAIVAIIAQKKEKGEVKVKEAKTEKPIVVIPPPLPPLPPVSLPKVVKEVVYQPVYQPEMNVNELKEEEDIIIQQSGNNFVFFKSNKGKDLQKAIDDLHSSGGGTIFLPRGSIVVDEPILLKTGVSLIGITPPPISKETIEASDYSSLVTTKDIVILRTDKGYSGEVKNIVIDGNWKSVVNLAVRDCRGATFRNIWSRRASLKNGVCCYVISKYDRCTNNLFENVKCQYGRIGMNLLSLNKNPVTLNVFRNCIFSAHYISLRFQQYTDTNQFYSCRIIVFPKGYGVVFERGEGIYNNVFYAPAIESIDGTGIGILCLPTKGHTGKPNKFIDVIFGWFKGNWPIEKRVVDKSGGMLSIIRSV